MPTAATCKTILLSLPKFQTKQESEGVMIFRQRYTTAEEIVETEEELVEELGADADVVSIPPDIDEWTEKEMTPSLY
ncbi:hypothetical protein lerEdw1_000287 [Lerista edwardsae]|nr:hypothetical protein lerEdw1_000287 [Lerista edwardsae]